MEIKILEKYRKILEDTFSGFPRGYCYDSSKILEYFEGLKSVSGYFIPEGEYQNKSMWREHYWNEDKKSGLEFDITQDQFQGINNKIIINKIGRGGLKKDKTVEKIFEQNYPNLKGYTNNIIKEIEKILI